MIEQIVKGIIEDSIGISPNDYTNDSEFKDDLGCDSLDIIDIIMKCEKEFNICISDDVLSKIITVNDLINYISEHSN